MKVISIGSDHAGYAYKADLVHYISEISDCEVIDRGTMSAESVDYPDFAHAVARDIAEGRAQYGILLCGSANGVAMAANRHEGVRCAICWMEELTRLARTHNDANILALPARFISIYQARAFVDIFLNTAFEGGRHSRRVNKISCISE